MPMTTNFRWKRRSSIPGILRSSDGDNLGIHHVLRQRRPCGHDGGLEPYGLGFAGWYADPLDHYSQRKAIIGSTRVARRAGI
jgi:hypothetical protein